MEGAGELRPAEGGGADAEAIRLLADLVLAQETGIADGSLVAGGGYVWPNPQAGTVPSWEKILAILREDARRDPFWDDGGLYG